MIKRNSFWTITVKNMLMSLFCSLVSFMLYCLIISTTAQPELKPSTIVLMQVIGIVCQFIFVYGIMWDAGYTDRQSNKLGETNYPMSRGLLLGFASAIPFYVMSILMMLMSLGVLFDITGLLRVLSSQFWGIYTVLLPVATGGNSETVSFAKSVATPAQAICAAFVPTILPLISFVPYLLGRKGIAIEEKILFKKKK